ncbi:hypothetical protein PHYBOEH_000251 [Phytophthora boehmeriae]|uniref:Bzip transcription factor n=1 Tax=Phytophthora boehmeriae TaxID=109152 RepID=A0A8T1VC77_9STRA|nr:hypothetical protein PHYBOEH_000251 [Phytophthora boehmeriae]
MKPVFQLPKKTNGEEIDKSMWTRLEGKRICCSCSINFLFDKTKGLVERLELCIDLMTPLQLSKDKSHSGDYATDMGDRKTFGPTPAHALTLISETKQQRLADSNAEANDRRQNCKPAQPPQLSSKLSDAQAATFTTGVRRSNGKLKATAYSRKMRSLCIAEWTKARRKEQRRVAQARFQSRKRQEWQGLIDSIKGLKQDIKNLEARKASLRKQQNLFVQLVAGFYSSLRIDTKQQQLPGVRSYERTQVLSDLQRAEYDSVESFMLHWHWIHSQFREFRLSVKSYECRQAGEHLIAKAAGDLVLEITSDDEKEKGKRQMIVCPVLQQFEFENGKQIVKRITSEVDLVGGVSNTLGPVDPERILRILRCVSTDCCGLDSSVDKQT